MMSIYLVVYMIPSGHPERLSIVGSVICKVDNINCNDDLYNLEKKVREMRKISDLIEITNLIKLD